MSGKELILYILQNDLENCDIQTVMNKAFVTIYEAAIQLKTGPESVKAMFDLGILPGIALGKHVYILNDFKGGEKDEKK